jgi:hypothetical protein
MITRFAAASYMLVIGVMLENTPNRWQDIKILREEAAL